MSYKAKRWVCDVRAIADVEGAGAKAWRRTQWQEQILVPALPQSALPGCSLIHVDYYLQVLGLGVAGEGVLGWEGGVGKGARCLDPHHPFLAGLPEGARSLCDPPGLRWQYRCEPSPAKSPARCGAASWGSVLPGALCPAPGGG